MGKKSYTGAVDTHHPRRPCLPSRLPYEAHFKSSWLETYTSNCAGPAYSCHSAAPLPGRTNLTPSGYTLPVPLADIKHTASSAGRGTRRSLLGARQGHSRVWSPSTPHSQGPARWARHAYARPPTRRSAPARTCAPAAPGTPRCPPAQTRVRISNAHWHLPTPGSAFSATLSKQAA